MGTSASLERSPAIARRSGARLVGLYVVGAVSGLVITAMLLLIGLRIARAGVLPGVTVGDAEVGGLDDQALREELAAYAERRGAEAVTATLPAQPPAAGGTIPATAAEVGYELDVAATADAVLDHGRQPNPLLALGDHLRSFTSTIAVEPVETVSPARLDGWVEDALAGLRREPQEGGVRFEGTQAVRVEAVPGVQGDAAALRSAAERAALSPGPDELTVSTVPIEPRISAAEVDAALSEAQRALSGPITLANPTASIDLQPADVATVLRVEPDETGDALTLVADPTALRARVGDPSPFDTPPVDASFQVQGGAVQLVDGRPGFRFDADAAATQLRDVAIGEGPRRVDVAGQEVEPEFTRAEAEALGITTQVSTFTTNHNPGEPRVRNIHRIADLIRGVVIRPGENFSVNDFVGDRTPEKGFVPAGSIENGELVQTVGGGISQFATTMFNAAYLGGYEIVEHKAHSQYISRYPEGREATLSYPGVDLEIRNNSPHGLYIDTSYTDTSITVSFYASPWVEVTTQTGERFDFTDPERVVRPTPDLPPGEERVIQEAGGQGFRVSVSRTMTFPDGRTESESMTTTYIGRPEIVERGIG